VAFTAGVLAREVRPFKPQTPVQQALLPGRADFYAHSASIQLQALRFCAVGLTGSLINLVAYSFQLDVMGTPPCLAAIGAFSIAVVNNHLLNRVWTFQERTAGYVGQGARFLAVSLLALAINLVVLALLLGYGVGPIEAQCLAIVSATPVAFLGNRHWTFQVRP